MVQLQDEGRQLNDYWKLLSGITMKSPGVRVKTPRIMMKKKTKQHLLQVLKVNHQGLMGKSIARLSELYIRQQRGFPSYDKVPARELRSLVVQRGLSSASTTRARVATLRAQLEQADDSASFDRFSDLPSELLQQIFEQYFDSFDDAPRGISPAGG